MHGAPRLVGVGLVHAGNDAAEALGQLAANIGAVVGGKNQ